MPATWYELDWNSGLFKAQANRHLDWNEDPEPSRRRYRQARWRMNEELAAVCCIRRGHGLVCIAPQ